MEKILGLLCLFLVSFAHAEFAVKSYRDIRSELLIRQTYEQSCGAAALATLINLLDSKKLTELDVLQKMSDKNQPLNTDMVSFKQLEITAEKLDYESRSYRLQREILDKFPIPLLVKIEDDPRFPHFVIVINHSGDYITILDPSFGIYLSSKSQFYSLWDRNRQGGFGLVLKPKNRDMPHYLPEIPPKVLFERLPRW